MSAHIKTTFFEEKILLQTVPPGCIGLSFFFTSFCIFMRWPVFRTHSKPLYLHASQLSSRTLFISYSGWSLTPVNPFSHSSHTLLTAHSDPYWYIIPTDPSIPAYFSFQPLAHTNWSLTPGLSLIPTAWSITRFNGITYFTGILHVCELCEISCTQQLVYLYASPQPL